MRLAIAIVLSFTSLHAYAQTEGPNFIYEVACDAIADVISHESDVYYPDTKEYASDNSHWALSSTTNSTCTVEPGTAEDVGKILLVLGLTRTPFGIKGAGHTANPGFSATPGVQIAMTRFTEVSYDTEAGIASVGAGNIWDNVYAGLEPYNVSVVGGRVSGIGVAGFTLGGGYSFKSNQYGLTIDTVAGFEIVLPTGIVVNATATDNSDLFFGLKGGFNNFGIVTTIYLETHPQTAVWGGSIVTTGVDDAVVAATQNFYETVTDPKAAILTTFNYDASLGLSITEMTIYYNAPTPPEGMFDDFMALPSLTKNISTRSYLSLILSTIEGSNGLRGYFHTVSLYEYTTPLLNAIVNETQFWRGQLESDVPEVFVSYDVEPILPSVFSHGTDSAWPPSRANGILPLNIYYAWASPDNDTLMNQIMVQSADYLTQVAVAEGQDIAETSLYPNYAIYDTTMERIYAGNLPRLRELKAKYDPFNVMGLSGGWKF
ncbi:FAD-binding domain-containing protein [Fomitopsis serialis]|uniref:FAD-binding domain-containing protein n=1 Tax=Fomitopsis serialis TaxID=139415 RepID=UPI002008800E|nr:FAD-binding domain-containing protein [Neoantrodia serialis]KAH9920717.1 FAD-binding domain-containing protein [Neoantrodia serialis]